MATSKKKASTRKPCAEGKHRHPVTHHCRSVGRKTKPPCKPGKRRSPKTHVCKKSSGKKASGQKKKKTTKAKKTSGQKKKTTKAKKASGKKASGQKKKTTKAKKASGKKASGQKKKTTKAKKASGQKKSSGKKQARAYSREYSSTPARDIPRPAGFDMYLFEGTTKNGNRSQKFWGVKMMGSQVCTRYGAVGAKARETCHTYPDAQKRFDQVVREKTREGYRRV